MWSDHKAEGPHDVTSQKSWLVASLYDRYGSDRDRLGSAPWDNDRSFSLRQRRQGAKCS
jgi:hypothetical protein